jgi:phosphatidylglycerol:prolipoprotein diacylglycerol transferase
MLPILHLGPLAIQTPGLIILLGIGLGLSLMERQAARYQVNGGVLSNIAFAGLLAGVVGARLAFVARYPSAFSANPGSLLSLNLTMFEPVWGIVLGLLTAGTYGWRRRIPLKLALDVFTSALAVLAIAVHLANLASGDAYGTPSNLPWAIELWGKHRHPAQIYETLAAVLILWLMWPRPGWYGIAGQRFLAFIAMSAGARIFLEAFRGDSVLWGGIRSAQVIAWVILAVCLWVLSRFQAKQT